MIKHTNHKLILIIVLILSGATISSAVPIITSQSNTITNSTTTYIPVNANKAFNLSVISSEGGTYNWIVDGAAVINNQSNLTRTYSTFSNHYINAYVNNSNGISNQVSWTISVKAPLATTTVSPISNKTQLNLTNSMRAGNLKGIIAANIEPATDILGNVFYAVIWGLLFATYWIRGGKVTMPSTIGVIFGAVIIGTLPGQYVFVSQILIIGGIFFVLYTFFKR